MENNQKRLFFGMEVTAPWPAKLPHGRLLDEAHRHMTLAFLGDIDFSKLSPLLNDFPLPPFQIGLVGLFDQCLFLPKRHPHVVAWHIHWLDDASPMSAYQKTCAEWLQERSFDPHVRGEFLPHVTICRAPFDEKKWRKAFTPLPVIIQSIHLYESIGKLQYVPIWSHDLRSPFEEIEHTADVAFKILGENFQQLHHHAEIALAFKFPELLPYLSEAKKEEDIDDIIIALNRIVTQADSEIGCPFKAVSFHGGVTQKPDNTLEWEMIIDV